jgi:glycosyl transferase-like sugar-binding protein
MIPRILHQAWLGPLRRPVQAMSTWRQKHPGWDYRLWTEGNLPPMRHRALFDAFHGIWHGQADILRYELLDQCGGVWLDADSVCLRPLDDFFLENEVWAIYENEKARPGQIANGFMGAAPGNGLIKAIGDGLDKLSADAIAAEDREKLRSSAWTLVGPRFFTEVVRTTGYPIRVYPSHYFLPEHFSGSVYGGDGPIYARHFWGTTRNAYVTASERRRLAEKERRRLRLAREESERFIPQGETFILVDQDWWGKRFVGNRLAVPFLERDGQYWGLPADDETAIRELERLRRAGANWMVFGWPTFWWLDFYRGLQRHLSASYRMTLKNERLVIFDLRDHCAAFICVPSLLMPLLPRLPSPRFARSGRRRRFARARRRGGLLRRCARPR